MATSSGNNNKLHEMLICPVCLDNYREARTLSCLHSFCTECLEGCRRVLRRDIQCPVCKHVTLLTTSGVRGLPADYRIEQIRDFIAADAQQTVNTTPIVDANGSSHWCDVCKSQQRSSVASQHCVQCLMQLCDACLGRHNSNPVLSTHQVVALIDSNAAASLFCVTHRQQPVRYFCCQCHSTLCTICAIEHDPTHKPESLENGIINKYRCRLSEALSTLASRLAEVKTRSKRLGAIRQSRQNDLYTVQKNIRDRTAQIIEHIKQREIFLLADAQSKFDAGLSTPTNGTGSDSLAELDFQRTELERLVNEVRLVLGGPPQSCLVAFDSLMARVTRLSESAPSNSSSIRLPSLKSVCFVPAPSSEVDLMIGCLQECSFSGSDDCTPSTADDCSEYPSTTSSPSRGHVASPSASHTALSNESNSSTRKRTASILGALSPARKSDSRLGRIKGIARSHSSGSWRANSQSGSSIGEIWRDTSGPGQSTSSSVSWRGDGLQSSSPPWRDNGWRDGSHNPARHINFDNVIGSTTRSGESSGSPMSGSLTSPSSPVSSSLPKLSAPLSLSPVPSLSGTPRLLFKVDKVGGLQGMIQSPVSVSFIADDDVLVAEADRRVQVFDRNGRSTGVIGWGNIKPLAACVCPGGLIGVAEKTSQTVRFYLEDGSDALNVRRWTDRMFGMPCSVAFSAATNQIVVADCDRRSVTMHSLGGAALSRVATEHLGSPTHVAVSADGIVYVSDALHSCVKVFDSTGQFIRQFTLPPRSQQTAVSASSGANASAGACQTVRPYGLCVSSAGCVYVCDRDGHRILVFTSDGQLVGDLFQSADAASSQPAVKYPCDVAVTNSVDNAGTASTLVAVAESCSGLLDAERHHAVKLYAF